jgi:hypothetical protein
MGEGQHESGTLWTRQHIKRKGQRKRLDASNVMIQAVGHNWKGYRRSKRAYQSRDVLEVEGEEEVMGWLSVSF